MSHPFKKLVAYAPAHILYRLGDLTSIITYKLDDHAPNWVVHVSYVVYNSLIVWSLDLSDWGGLHMWEEPASVATLEQIDASVENFKKGIVGKAIYIESVDEK